jgi:hypothetical protein
MAPNLRAGALVATRRESKLIWIGKRHFTGRSSDSIRLTKRRCKPGRRRRRRSTRALLAPLVPMPTFNILSDEAAKPCVGAGCPRSLAHLAAR